MVLDNEIDKKRLMHIIASFQFAGPYKDVGPAVKQLDGLMLKVEQAQTMEQFLAKNGGKTNRALREVK